MKKGFSFSLVVLAIALAFASAVYAETASCLSLGTDLFPGDKNESVRFLQKFLVERGYLAATPNGVYGPATTAAVRAFQKANSISATGNVGPTTRNVIATKGCATLPGQTASAISSIPQPSSAPVASTQTASIASPGNGEAWTIGKTYIINWNAPTNYMYDIVLDNKDGSSGGFITHHAVGGNSFTWRAGNVQTSLGEETAATGTYRVRIQSSTGVQSRNDPISAWFTLEGIPLTVNSINPTSVMADLRGSVVLYGSGFDSTTSIRLDGEYGPMMNILYRSPDDTIIVFSVPTNISGGSHALYVGNQYTAAKNVGTLSVMR